MQPLCVWLLCAWCNKNTLVRSTWTSLKRMKRKKSHPRKPLEDGPLVQSCVSQYILNHPIPEMSLSRTSTGIPAKSAIDNHSSIIINPSIAMRTWTTFSKGNHRKMDTEGQLDGSNPNGLCIGYTRLTHEHLNRSTNNEGLFKIHKLGE